MPKRGENTSAEGIAPKMPEFYVIRSKVDIIEHQTELMPRPVVFFSNESTK